MEILTQIEILEKILNDIALNSMLIWGLIVAVGINIVLNVCVIVALWKNPNRTGGEL